MRLRHRVSRHALVRSLTLCCAGAMAPAALAQRGSPNAPAGSPYNIPYDGRFTFARLTYTTGPGGYYYRNLPAWAHGYATAEFNLMRILREVSSVRPHLEATNTIGILDPKLFNYPVAYMTEPGYWVESDAEVVALRKYLLKGGFLILDDTRDDRGNPAWANIENNFRRIFPDLHFIDLTPDHPIFHAFFEINSFSIVHQYYDYGPPVFRALFENNDPRQRMLVMLNYNTDVSNYWEFSPQGFVPIEDSNQAYKLGVNYLLYALER